MLDELVLLSGGLVDVLVHLLELALALQTLTVDHASVRSLLLEWLEGRVSTLSNDLLLVREIGRGVHLLVVHLARHVFLLALTEGIALLAYG